MFILIKLFIYKTICKEMLVFTAIRGNAIEICVYDNELLKHFLLKNFYLLFYTKKVYFLN